MAGIGAVSPVDTFEHINHACQDRKTKITFLHVCIDIRWLEHIRKILDLNNYIFFSQRKPRCCYLRYDYPVLIESVREQLFHSRSQVWNTSKIS